MLLRVERRMVLKVPWGLVAVTLAVAVLPDPSRATALIVRVPFDTVELFQLVE